MSAQDFDFALDIAAAPDSNASVRELLSDLVARVLERAGAGGDATAGLADAIQRAVANGSRGSEGCRVQFQARDGRLRIVVSSRAGEIWQREIPQTH